MPRTAKAGAKKAAPKKAAPRKTAAKKTAAKKTAAKKTSAASGAQERLERYRDKRDFTRSPEPAGTAPPEPDGHRFVVQRHRASRLHYDFRLEAAGVLISWAVPKGPTLDPKARRMAVHVEDHPLDYYDFEGVIPKGEYGGGDVIVWDWGTWRVAEDADPLEAIAKGNLHFDLEGEKLAGRFVLVRKGRPGGAAAKDQWLLLHKADDHAVAGWDPEDHPRSVKSGRTNDEVLAEPAATWHSNRGAPTAGWTVPTWDAPTADELDALDALGKAGEWELGGHRLRLTNLDKVLFPARPGDPAVTKRDLVRYHATIAPRLLPYLFDRPVNLNRYPDGAGKPGFWQKAAPSYAPAWIRRWTYDGAGEGETKDYLVLDAPAAVAWSANHAGFEIHPWTSRIPAVHEPTWALIDIDPGTSSSFEDVLVLARLFRTALEHLGVAAAPKVSGRRGIQIFVPVAAGLGFDDTRAWVERLSRAVGATVPELVSWEWEKKRRGGLARLDYTQNAINKTLVAPYSVRPAAGAPVSVPLRWEQLDDPGLRPDGWTVHTVVEQLDRLDAEGDPLRALIGLQQELPKL